MGLGILILGEDGLNADGAGGFIDAEVGGVGEAVEQGEADIVIADSAGKKGFFLMRVNCSCRSR